jgi:hypothetical protein
MAASSNVFTYVLTNSSFTILETDQVLELSVLCSVGTITVVGNGTFQGLNSTSITFSVGQGFTLSTRNFGNPITGITITAGVGSAADILISKN